MNKLQNGNSVKVKTYEVCAMVDHSEIEEKVWGDISERNE